jgi:hypothetical protein
MEETVHSRQAQVQAEVKKIFLNKRASRLIIIFIVLILATLPSYYFYNKYQASQKLLQNPNQASIAETQALVNNVGKLIELPANENPTIATVSDKTQLANQPFFAHAQNGDKVLIYQQAKKVILYRPSINKIIEVAPLNIGSGSPTSVPAVQAQSPNPSINPTASPNPIFVPIPTSTAVPAQ